jgi:hypothetical protein
LFVYGHVCRRVVCRLLPSTIVCIPTALFLMPAAPSSAVFFFAHPPPPPSSVPRSAIVKAFGGTPTLTCSSGELTVVGLCLDKNLAAIDCPSNLASSCSSSFTFPAA